MKPLLIATMMTALLRAPESDPPATGSGPDTAVPDSDAPTDAVPAETTLGDAVEGETSLGDAPDGPTDPVPAETAAPEAVMIVGPGGQVEINPAAAAAPIQEGDTVTLHGVLFTFKTAPEPSNPFEVEIGETAEATKANLEARMAEAQELGLLPIFLPPGSPAPQPEPETRTEAEIFDERFPDFGPWFDRVQKWAQFNSRPIPEPGPTWADEFAANVAPEAAAEKNCMPQT